eukprot:g1283.t1
MDTSPDVCVRDYCLTSHTIAWIIAGICCVSSIWISVKLINQHMRKFTRPLLQRKIVGILWIVPIFAVDSWLSLRFIGVSIYLDMIRDCYESYVIYLFLALMLSFLTNGNEDALVVQLDALQKRGRYVFPFNWIWTDFVVDRGFLKMCKRGAMQFCVFKPTCTLLATILQARGLYGEGEWRVDRGYMWITILLNFSISWAAYCLLLFYLAFHDLLAPFRPVPKFLSIKAVLFLSFWQGVLFSALNYFDFIHEIGAYTANDVQTALQDFCVCVEMLIMAIAHRYAFPAEPFAELGFEDGPNPVAGGGLGTSMARRLDDGLTTLLRDDRVGSEKGVWRDGVLHGLLRNNFAVDDAVRDFNDTMPVALPSAYEPGQGISTRRPPLPRAPDIFAGASGVKQKKKNETNEELL